MLWKILGLVLALSPMAFADSLVKEMEVEIRVQQTAKEVVKIAREAAREAVKKTSLWGRYKEAENKYHAAEARREEEKVRYQEALERMRSYEKRALPPQKGSGFKTMRELMEYSDAGGEVETREQYMKRREHFRKTDPIYLQLFRTAERLRVNVGSFRTTKVLRALSKWRKVEDEVNALTRKFTRKVYLQEMKRKLKELEVEITKDILKKIERSYRLHQA